MVDEKYRKLNFQKAVTLLGGAGFSEDELNRRKKYIKTNF